MSSTHKRPTTRRGREQQKRANATKRGEDCHDCGTSFYDCAFYMVQNTIWQTHGVKQHLLCLGCLRRRLGQRLNPDDFTHCPLNDHTIEPFFEARQMTELMSLLETEGCRALDVMANVNSDLCEAMVEQVEQWTYSCS